MTSPINIIRRAIYRGNPLSSKEDAIASAINEIGISGGYSSAFVVRRIRSALEHETTDSVTKFSQALDDLNIGGGSGDPFPLERIRNALAFGDQPSLKIAFDDLLSGIVPMHIPELKFNDTRNSQYLAIPL